MTRTIEPRAGREFLRFFLMLVLGAVAIASGCVVNAEVQRSAARREYQRLDREVASFLRLGQPKAEVLQRLRERQVVYVDWARPHWEPDGLPPEVTVLVRKYSGFPFPEELYLGLHFKNGHLAGWGPWYQGGP